MSLVLVFDSFEKACEEASKVKSSYTAFMEVIQKRYREKEQAWRKSTGYDEKTLESQKRRYKKDFGEDTDISCFLINPELIGIPREERDELAKNLGSDLSFYAAFHLNSHKPGYSFFCSIEDNDFIGHPSDNFDDMQSLSIDVKRKINTISKNYYDACVTPYFYTVREDSSFKPEEASGMKNFLEFLLKSEAPSELSPKEIGEASKAINDIDFTKSINTGLSDEEIAEFERYYLEK